MVAEAEILPAAQAGTITLGGDLTVNRMGYGAMRITGKRYLGTARRCRCCSGHASPRCRAGNQLY